MRKERRRRLSNTAQGNALTLTFARIRFQSSTNFSVHLSTMVVVCSGDASLAKYGP